MNNNQENNKLNRTNGANGAPLEPGLFLSLMGNLRGLLGFVGLIVLMALMSCSSSDDGDDPVEPSQNSETPIAFSANQSEESDPNTAAARTRGANGMTRGTSLHDANIDEFVVWGYKNMAFSTGVYGGKQQVFPGYEVDWQDNSATTSNSNGWEYILTTKPDQTIKYWDWGAVAYRYYAVTGSEDTDYTYYAESGTYGDSYEKVYFTMTADASSADNIAATPYFSKLWFSTGNEALYPTRRFGKPVQLEFMKPFSKVRFMFNYSYEAEAIKLKDPSFKPTDNSKIDLMGTFTVTYPLEGTATSESYAITNIDHSVGLAEFDKEYIPEGGAEREVWYTVLPIDPSTPQGSYTLSVSVNGLTKTCVVPAQYMQWKPGFSYTYVFKITDDGGVEIDMVLSAFTPWEVRESENYEVYNW